jgi:hypothetical protein
VYLHLLLYPRGQCYNEGNCVDYNMISIITLSLLAYFTYIYIYIIIYALGITSWSSWKLLYGGLSRNESLLRLSESLRGGTLDTNLRHSDSTSWVLSSEQTTEEVSHPMVHDRATGATRKGKGKTSSNSQSEHDPSQEEYLIC